MHLQRVFATAALSLVAACSSSPTILTSLEDLTSEADRQGLSAANQNRIVSITGLLPQAQVGTFYRYDRKRAPSTAIGISDDGTFLIETKIPAPDERGGAEKDESDTDRSHVHRANDDSLANRIVDQVTEVRAAARISLERLLGSVQARAALAKAEAEAEEDPPDNIDELRTAAEEAKEKYEEARAEFDTKLLAASKLIKDSGFIVVRWDAADSSEASASAAPLFSGSRSRSQRTSGFAILSGLRLMTLFVGPDIKEAVHPLKRRWVLFDFEFPFVYASMKFPYLGTFKGDYRLTTHVLQTKRVQYFQDAELAEEVSLAIEASYEQLENVSKALSETEKVEAAYVAKSLKSLSNFGSLEGVQRAYYPAPLAPDSQVAKKRLDSSLKEKAANLRKSAVDPKAAPSMARTDVVEILESSNMASDDSPFRSYLSRGKCLSFTGRCIEDQITQRMKAKLPALTPDMDGWLTIYAVDVDADALCREFR